jgi:hypothetical protein
MLFALFVFFAELLLILFPGLVLHRALARQVLALDEGDSAWAIDEVDLLAFGLLPGLALANTVGTVLAIFHLFYWWSYSAAMIVLVAWRWRDALATLSAIVTLVRRSFRSLARGNLMVVVAAAIFLQTGAGMLAESMIPSANIDVWNHNLPLAQSIVAHYGFVMPQIPHMFYGSYPIFFQMFFAEALLFFDGVIAAKAANAMIYLGFLLSLLGFARHARALAAVILALVIVEAPFFSAGAADAMTDIGRVCFSALAFAFAYQYFRTERLYFLFASGLVAGGAIAGKYTEMLTPIFIGLSLLPALVMRKKGSWLAVLVFVAATAITGAYPYLRNLILLHNPIYPFVFSHPGLSDDQMKAIQTEIFRVFDPAFEGYSQNLLSLRGWHDFAMGARELFFNRWKPSYYLYAVTGAGLLFLRSRALLLLALWTFGMWIFWYLVGKLNPRWGLTPFMLFAMLAYLAFVGSVDRLIEAPLLSSLRWRPAARIGFGAAARGSVAVWLTPMAVARTAVTVWALVIGVGAIQSVMANGMLSAFPSWLNRDLARAAVQPDGFQAHLVNTRPGYEIYRYIGDHDLRKVLQPFDNGAWAYQIAYNDGKNGDWLVPWYSLPAQPADFDEYLRNNKIRYFVYCPKMDPQALEQLGQGSYNPRHAEITRELMRYILPGSRLILTDRFGWELREMPSGRLK